MIRIEFPKLLAWFQTHQTVSRPSRPSRPLVPDTSDRFQTVQTRFPALKLGHFLWKKNQNGPSGVHLTHYCPQHLALISQMKVHTSTPEHCFPSPHLSISLSLMRLFRMLMRWPSIGVGSCAIIFWTGAWADDLDFFLGGEQISSFHNLSLK